MAAPPSYQISTRDPAFIDMGAALEVPSVVTAEHLGLVGSSEEELLAGCRRIRPNVQLIHLDHARRPANATAP